MHRMRRKDNGSATELVERLKVWEETVRNLLNDYMLIILSRWSRDAESPRHLARVMHKPATNAEQASDISPLDLSPKEKRPRS